jgi:aminoglycoside phosphotransferase (APT) family kinase protein
MKTTEILRLAHTCLPQLTSVNDTAVHESDLQVKSLCRLWGGMGHIYRVTHTNDGTSFIVKHITPPPLAQQSFGDRRKAVSYDVEANFYKHLAAILVDTHGLTIPRPLHVECNDTKQNSKQITICMTFVESQRKNLPEKEYNEAVLTWLATLHASYWGDTAVDEIVEKVGLNPIGSYWYLDTRPDEHANMPSKGWEGRLKRAARAIDGRLQRDSMQCLIHGDAKDANVIVTADEKIFMCDFQYCGKGPPTRDLAYFLCTSANVKSETEALSFYLNELTLRLPPGVTPPTLGELQESLELAYCDFCRFMSGWGYWGGNVEGRVKAVLDKLDGGKDLGSEEAYEAAVMREFG